MTDDEVMEKNLTLSFEFSLYVAQHPEFARQIPANSRIVLIPGDSFFHRLHPVAKLVWSVGAVVLAFATRNPLVLGAVFLVGLLLFVLSGTWRGYKRFIAILFPISLSLMVFQSLAPAFPPPWTPIAKIGPFPLYNEGIYSGLSILARAWAASNLAILMVMTTHPSDLFAALQSIGMPYELNFILMASLQLIPIVQREFRIVVSAQRSRAMRAHGFALRASLSRTVAPPTGVASTCIRLM